MFHSGIDILFLHGSQMKTDTDPPQLTFFLLIHNMGPVGGSGTNLFQVAIRDSISGIVPLKSEGRVVERGYQMFSIDSLSGKDQKCLRAESKNSFCFKLHLKQKSNLLTFLAGSQITVNYTAHIRSHKSEVLDLPAFLTFSNTSQVFFYFCSRNFAFSGLEKHNSIFVKHGVTFS